MDSHDQQCLSISTLGVYENLGFIHVRFYVDVFAFI